MIPFLERHIFMYVYAPICMFICIRITMYRKKVRRLYSKILTVVISVVGLWMI